MFRFACPFVASFLLLTPGCRPSSTSAPREPAQEQVESSSASVDDARGGRLFDKWYAELELDFEPGVSGGPHGDGTVRAADGRLYDHEGHQYRIKNLFGWDLRGAQGVYGAQYQKKAHVLSHNLLEDTRSVDELAQWLSQGDEDVPAFGTVMDDAALRDVAEFIVAVREGRLPRPEQIWTLSVDAPSNYVLNEGADVEQGAALYAERCAGCHGADGRDIAIDEVLSLGAFARTKAYEGWLKILNGHPGSEMHRMIEFGSGEEGAAQILDVLASLCDRSSFPPIDGQQDVPDGDPRCGTYLR